MVTPADVEAWKRRVRQARPRGMYVPASDAQGYLHAGAVVLDDCPPAPGFGPGERARYRDEVLLLLPDEGERR